MVTYSRLKLSRRACKSESASDNGVVGPPAAPPLAPPPPEGPAPTAVACGCLTPETDSDPDV